MRFFCKLFGKIKDDRGETLLEVVVSIGLFALMMLMVASMFAMASKTTRKNLETDERVDRAVSAISEVQAGDTVNCNGNAVDTRIVSVTFTASGETLNNPYQQVRLVETEGMYKYTE